MSPRLYLDGQIICKVKLEPKEDYYVFIVELGNSYNLLFTTFKYLIRT